MCRKGEFKPHWEGAKRVRYESQADDLYSQAASTQLGDEVGGGGKAGSRAAAADWVCWDLPFVWKKEI